ICHLCQRSGGFLAKNGRAKLSGNSKPSSLAQPRAMSVYPEKSKNTCMKKARQPDHAASQPGCAIGSLKYESDTTANRSANTIFFNRPETTRMIPLWTIIAAGYFQNWICEMNCRARMIGPAIKCGKNAMNS